MERTLRSCDRRLQTRYVFPAKYCPPSDHTHTSAQGKKNGYLEDNPVVDQKENGYPTSRPHAGGVLTSACPRTACSAVWRRMSVDEPSSSTLFPSGADLLRRQRSLKNAVPPGLIEALLTDLYQSCWPLLLRHHLLNLQFQ